MEDDLFKICLKTLSNQVVLPVEKLVTNILTAKFSLLVDGFGDQEMLNNSGPKMTCVPKRN